MVCSQNSKQLFLFSKSKLQLLETVFRLHFSKIYFQPSFVTIISFFFGFVAWLRTVALSKFQWVRHTNALNLARLHLAVLGGRVLYMYMCATMHGLRPARTEYIYIYIYIYIYRTSNTSTFWVHVQNLKEHFCWVGTDRGAAPAEGRWAPAEGR